MTSPHLIGRYEVVAELGRGGMAIVYRAFDPQFGRDVAIKVLPREFLFDAGFRQRFEREARTIAALEHYAIVPVYDFGEQEGQPYLVMRYMPGGSLADRIEGGWPVPLEGAAAIVGRVGAALDTAHRRNVIHRDVKPGNVLFDGDGFPYLTDFGIVKLTEATAQLTGSGMVGTPAYMAPEMARPGGVTPLIDVYALGVTLYQMLTGQLPYDADTPMGLLMAHVSTPIPDIHDCCPHLPAGVQDVIERALAKDPVDRYRRAGELADALRAVAVDAGPERGSPGVENGAAVLPVEDAERLPTLPTLEDTPPELPTVEDAPRRPVEPPPVEPVPVEEGPPARSAPAARPAPTSHPAPTSRPAPTARPRRGLPAWAWIGGIVAVAALLVGGLALAGVLGGGAAATPAPEQAEAAVAGGDGNQIVDGQNRTAVIGTTGQIVSLDYADSYAVHDWELFRNVNRGLLELEPGTLNVVPAVATDMPAVSADGRTYTFIIGGGWKYPDGTELVADDFVRGIERARTLGGSVQSLVSPYVASVEAPDARTLVIRLTRPIGYFPQIVTGTAYMPVPEGAYPDDELNGFPETVVGVGPYQITDYAVGEQIVLERNPNYREGFPAGAPGRVVIRYFEDATQMGLAVENGEIDVAWRMLGPIEANRLDDVDGLTLYDTGSGSIRYLVLNHAMAPMADKNVRQALAYLIDRDELIDRAVQGRSAPLYSMVLPGLPGANEAFRDRYDSPNVTAAEELLAASGYSADNPLVFDLWYPPERYGAHVARIFQLLEEQFEATPLIRINLQSQVWSDYIGALVGGEYPIGYLGWYFDYPDPSNYLEPFAQSEMSPSFGVNYTSGEMDQLLAAAAASTDQAKRAQIYEEAQHLYAEDVVTIPLTVETEYAVLNDASVSAITIGPALIFDYTSIRFR